MKIQILKEKDWYFIKFVWIQWIYATWETMDDALENFWDVYKNVIDLKKNFIRERTHNIWSISSFKKLELTI